MAASTDANLTSGSWTLLGAGPLSVHTRDALAVSLIYFGPSSPALDVGGTSEIRKNSQIFEIGYGGTENVYARALSKATQVTVIPGT